MRTGHASPVFHLLRALKQYYALLPISFSWLHPEVPFCRFRHSLFGLDKRQIRGQTGKTVRRNGLLLNTKCARLRYFNFVDPGVTYRRR